MLFRSYKSDYAEAWEIKAFLLNVMGKWSVALEFNSMALECDPDNKYTWRFQRKLLRKLCKRQEANDTHLQQKHWRKMRCESWKNKMK